MRTTSKPSPCSSPRRLVPERAALALLAAILALPACGPGTRPPLFWAQRLQPHDVGQVIVVTANDDRIDRSVAVNLDTQLRDQTVTWMRERGWEATAGELPAAADDLRLDELADANPATIRRLTIRGGRWVMVVGLVDVTTALTFGSTGNAEVAGYLFDTETEALLWRDRGVGQVGVAGLLGMAMVAYMDEEAIHAAVKKLIAGLPPREAPTARRP
jgi:hypothetical protein